MKYRGVAYMAAEDRFYYVYGLPSYGFNTDRIEEIGTPDGDFTTINPATLGRATGYHDMTQKEMYTGDIVELKVDGEVRRFKVIETTVDREYNVLQGFKGKTVKVRLQGVIAFEWEMDGTSFILLPCVDSRGVCDTEKMRIVGDIHTRAERELP